LIKFDRYSPLAEVFKNEFNIKPFDVQYCFEKHLILYKNKYWFDTVTSFINFIKPKMDIEYFINEHKTIISPLETLRMEEYKQNLINIDKIISQIPHQDKGKNYLIVTESTSINFKDKTVKIPKYGRLYFEKNFANQTTGLFITNKNGQILFYVRAASLLSKPLNFDSTKINKIYFDYNMDINQFTKEEDTIVVKPNQFLLLEDIVKKNKRIIKFFMRGKLTGKFLLKHQDIIWAMYRNSPVNGELIYDSILSGDYTPNEITLIKKMLYELDITKYIHPKYYNDFRNLIVSLQRKINEKKQIYKLTNKYIIVRDFKTIKENKAKYLFDAFFDYKHISKDEILVKSKTLKFKQKLTHANIPQVAFKIMQKVSHTELFNEIREYVSESFKIQYGMEIVLLKLLNKHKPFFFGNFNNTFHMVGKNGTLKIIYDKKVELIKDVKNQKQWVKFNNFKSFYIYKTDLSFNLNRLLDFVKQATYIKKPVIIDNILKLIIAGPTYHLFNIDFDFPLYVKEGWHSKKLFHLLNANGIIDIPYHKTSYSNIHPFYTDHRFGVYKNKELEKKAKRIYREIKKEDIKNAQINFLLQSIKNGPEEFDKKKWKESFEKTWSFILEEGITV